MADIHIQCYECRKSTPETEGYYLRNACVGYNPNVLERFVCKRCSRKYRNGHKILWYALGGLFLTLIILMLVKKLYTLGIL